MKLLRSSLGYTLILGVILSTPFVKPEFVSAAESSFDMKTFQSQMHTDFILPSVLSSHPGPMFYFSHSKELSLSDTQTNKIKKITHKIIPKTAKQLKNIEELKSKYLKLMQSPSPSFSNSKKLLYSIGKLEAVATSDHLEAHLDCYKVLTPEQKKILAHILAAH